MRFAVVAQRATGTNARLAEAAARLGCSAAVLSPRDALRGLEPGDVALGRLDVRSTVDGMEAGEDDLDRLAGAGITVLNPAFTLAAAHDKLLTARVLRRAGVPHPRTWHVSEGRPSPAPELPVVLKPRFGSWGRDVVRCDTPEELAAAAAGLAARPWFAEHGVLAQELVEPRGWDLRVLVAAGRVVGSARRVAAAGEWRTNVALGARIEPAKAPPVARSLALAAAAAVRGDFVGVDLLPVGSGYVVLEVNAAVDVRPLYSPADVYGIVVGELLEAARAPVTRTASA
ncbi:MAG TPA: ATP-grasp domain-containing protein [Gaiellaceae bacterium]|nr:ATP-grasp domain-containing protein [Gaiellaceae bacterium]